MLQTHGMEWLLHAAMACYQSLQRHERASMALLGCAQYGADRPEVKMQVELGTSLWWGGG